MDILPSGVQINFGGLRCYDGINLDGDLIVNAGIVRLSENGATSFLQLHLVHSLMVFIIMVLIQFHLHQITLKL